MGLLYSNLGLNKELLYLTIYGHALDLALGIDCDYLGDSILAIVIEQQLRDRCTHRGFVQHLTCAMLSGLNSPTGETYDHQILPIKVKVHAEQSRDLVLALLPPETFLPVRKTIGPVVQGVSKDLRVDLPQVLDLGLLLDIEDHFLVLEDSDREIIGAHDELLLPVVIPVHKLDGRCIVSGDCPEALIRRDVEAGDRAITPGHNKGFSYCREGTES